MSEPLVLVVRAFIDGHSQLILEGGTARWRHIEANVVGRWGGHNDPTIINGVRWLPKWPDKPDRINLNCNCLSDTLVGVRPPLPAQFAKVTLTPVSCRNSCTVTVSGSRVTIDFNDPDAEARWYEVKLTIEAAPSLVVNSAGDAGDRSPGDGVCDTGGKTARGEAECTLRAAIQTANGKAGEDRVTFKGVSTVAPRSALPPITQALVLDGSTQGRVRLVGKAAGKRTDGLTITAEKATVKGLVVERFGGRGIERREQGEGPVELENLEILSNRGHGIRSRSDGKVTLRNVRIVGNRGWGISLDGPLEIEGTENEIRGNGGPGISGGLSENVIIDGVTIVGNCGWGISTSGVVQIADVAKINRNGRKRGGDGGGVNTENDVLAQEADLVEVIGNGDDGVRTKGSRADVVLTNAKVNDNLGDGIQAQGVVKLRQSEVCGNRGYGIFADRRDLKQVRLDCDNRRGPFP